MKYRLYTSINMVGSKDYDEVILTDKEYQQYLDDTLSKEMEEDLFNQAIEQSHFEWWIQPED